MDIFNGNPIDPIEYIYREKWLTLSSIGSIFTFGLVGSFRSNIFDRIMGYILPVESFEYMKVKLPDIGPNPQTSTIHPFNPSEVITSVNPSEINFGEFVRESIIWIFMTLFLYILATFIRFPDGGGINLNTNQK